MQRYFAQTKEGDYFSLKQEDYYHIKTVMRMNSKDKIEVVYQNEVFLCGLEFHEKEILVKAEQKQEGKEDVFPRLVLILPFLKEPKMDFILQKGTELGVAEFILIEMDHSIVKIDEKKESSKIDRWSRICKEAAEQSMRTSIPMVRIERNLNALLELPGHKVLCSTQEREKTIKKLLKNVNICDTMNVMIGPEGGLSKEEEKYFEEKGFTKVSLGTQIMRVETVPIFLSSVIRYEYME